MLPRHSLIFGLAATVCSTTAFTAAAGSITLQRATTGAAAGADADTLLQAQLEARDNDPGFVSAYFADDVDLNLPSDGGVHVTAISQGGSAISNIDARTIGNRIDVSGTSRSTSDGASNLQNIVFDINSTGGSFTVTAHDDQSYDRALLSSLRVYDNAGVEVAFDNTLITNGNGLPSIGLTLAAGSYKAVLTADASAASGDDHFALSAATLVPSPTAVAAGLLGLVALAGRRRRDA